MKNFSTQESWFYRILPIFLGLFSFFQTNAQVSNDPPAQRPPTLKQLIHSPADAERWMQQVVPETPIDPNAVPADQLEAWMQAGGAWSAPSGYRGNFDPTLLHGSHLQQPDALQQWNKIKERDPSAVIYHAPMRNTPIFCSGRLMDANLSDADSRAAAVAATQFLDQIKPLMQTNDPDLGWQLRESHQDQLGNWHIRFDQYYQQIPIWASDIVVHTDQQGIKGFNGQYSAAPAFHANPVPAMDAATALQQVTTDLGSAVMQQSMDASDLLPEHRSATLSWLAESSGELRLVWSVQFLVNAAQDWSYIIDAQTGVVLKKNSKVCSNGPATATALDLNNTPRIINTYLYGTKYYLLDASKPMFDGNNSNMPNFPVGGIITKDGLDKNRNDPGLLTGLLTFSTTNNIWSNKTAVSAHANANDVYNYYRNRFNRNSFDGNGKTITSVINVRDEDGTPMDNAFWSTSLNMMFYGNGNTLFTAPLAKNVDISAHEITHGVTAYSAKLVYEFQSGALNESMSDVFACMVDTTDWQLGEGVANPAYFPSGAMRDLADPHNGTSIGNSGWQPRHMSEYVNTTQDNGGVHINSGIPNHAFYLFATQVGRKKAEQVYYHALTDYLTQQSQFLDCRLGVIQCALELYGTTVADAAAAAFDAVGIIDPNGSGGTPFVTELPQVTGSQRIIMQYINVLYQPLLTLWDVQTESFGGFAPAKYAAPKPTITEDGKITAFVHIYNHKPYLYNFATQQLTQIPLAGNWHKIAISPDGKKFAAIKYPSTTPQIYLYQTNGTQLLQVYDLYLPGSNGEVVGKPKFPDVIEFDPTGEYLIFDNYTVLFNNNQDSVGVWNFHILRVWNNSTNLPGDGRIYPVFVGNPIHVNVGNPTFSKNSSYRIAFDYFNTKTLESATYTYNLLNDSLYLINLDNSYALHQDFLYSYPTIGSKDDKVAYNDYDPNYPNDSYYALCIHNLGSNKLSPSGIEYFPSGTYYDDNGTGYPYATVPGINPVWYTYGQRNWQPVQANFTANVVKGNAPLTVNFKDLSTNFPTNWTWTFDGGFPASSNEQNPVITYNAPGKYTVVLTASNPNSTNTKTRTQYIEVLPPVQVPQANFMADVTSGFAPLTVHFTDLSTNAPDTWLWNFGNGQTSTLQNPTFTYTVPGVYNVTLISSNSAGSSTLLKTGYITVLQIVPPVANFVANITSGTAPLTVNFTDLSTNSPTSWSWSFGNGQFSSLQNPVVTYMTPGTYTVKLTASNSGGTNTATKTAYITVLPVLPPPVADFTANVTSGMAPLTVNFTDLSTNSPSNWVWDFGNGQLSTQQNPVVTYDTPGTYTVKLTASNGSGGNTITKTAYITVSPTVLTPVANFTANVTSGTAPLTVTFQDLSSNAPTNWVWDFGNGQLSTQQNPVVTYNTPGTYTVKLTASNISGGNTITKTAYITVLPIVLPPIANFNADITSGFAPLTVHFQDLSSNVPTGWSWDFGNGQVSSLPNPTITYNTPGIYTVKLTVSNSAGTNTATKTSYITVEIAPQIPIANFSASITCVQTGSTVQFTDASSNNPTSWAWQFPGGTPSSSNLPNPVVTYSTAGVYNASLVVTNSVGSNSSEKTGYITVMQPVTLAAFPGTSICAGNSVVLQANGASNYFWSGASLNGNVGPVVSALLTTAGSYNYTVFGTTNNCSLAPQTITIEVTAQPNLEANASQSEFCLGESVTLSATGALAYSWSGTGLDVTQGSVVTATPQVAGTYTYVVSGTTNGCVGTPKTLTIKVNPKPVLGVSLSSGSICLGESVSMSALGATNYLWNGPGITNLSGAEISVTPQVTSLLTYTVQGNQDGCLSTIVNIPIEVKPLPVVTAGVNATTVCLGDSINLTASGADDYAWIGPGLNASSGPNVSATTNTPGTVVFTVTGMTNGCSALPVTVQSTVEYHPLSAEIDVQGCPGPTLFFTVNATNAGVSPNINWFLNNDSIKNGQNYTLFNAQNGSQIYCVVTPVTPLVCTQPIVVQSNVITVTCIPIVGTNDLSDKTGIVLAPNPNTGAFSVILDITAAEDYDVYIHNSIGKTIQRQTIHVLPGDNQIDYQLGDLPSGTYWLSMISTHGIRRKAFEIIR
jgi:PKD repeat protein/Zn-dependent metalloprotease